MKKHNANKAKTRNKSALELPDKHKSNFSLVKVLQHFLIRHFSSSGQVQSQDVKLALKPPKEAEVSLLSLPESRRWCLESCILSSQDCSFLLLPDFLGLALSFLLLASGCSLPFIYLVPYALGNGLSQQNAAFLMSILGVIDIVGNITFGWLTDRKYESVLFSFDR